MQKSRKMRILIVHSFYRPTLPSGENSVVRNQVNALSDFGHEVRLWGPTSSGTPNVRKKISVGSKLLLNSGANPLLEISEFQPDLIHVHNLFPNISTAWLNRTEIPTIMTLHNYRLACANGVFVRDGELCIDCLNSSRSSGISHGCYTNSRLASSAVTLFQQRLQTNINRNLEALIFPALLQKQLLEGYTNTVRREVIPNYVPPYIQTSGTPTFKDRTHFLVLSRLSNEKGLEELLKIWPQEFELVIAGDGPLRDHLEREAKGKNISFLGAVSPERRDSLLEKSLALLIPSLTLEVDPLVVPESLSAGVPCLALAHTATALLAVGSPAVRTYSEAVSLRESLFELAHQDLSREAKRLYAANWSRETWLDSYHGLINSL